MLSLSKSLNAKLYLNFKNIKYCLLSNIRPYLYFKLQESNIYRIPIFLNCNLFLVINTSVMAGNRYCIDLAKRGTAGCKKCKVKIEKGIVRIGKIIPNPFTDDGGEMKQWFHVRCMFEQLSRARATTKKIESTDDLEGWDDIEDEKKDEVLTVLKEFSSSGEKKTPQKRKGKADDSVTTSDEKPKKKVLKSEKNKDDSQDPQSSTGKRPNSTKDDSFREFRKLCTKISEESSYTGKTAIVSEFITNGSDGKGFKGDLYLLVKMLLPGVNKRVFNLQSKQLVKLFCQIFDANQDEMLEDLEQGDVAETIRIFFESSESYPPTQKSSLSLQEVDKYLNDLTKVTKEEDQSHVLKKIANRCTSNDLKMVVRLIKHDLRINAGPKHILEAVHPTAYEAFQASRNLEDVIRRSLKDHNGESSQNELAVRATLMTPVLPMLAEACRSVEYAFKKCPNGLLVEIKYDGERVQVHKKGSEFSYFSRSLKPVMPHKVAHLKDFIPKAFPHGNDLILDTEILLVDNEGTPLPFGTLGKHKKTAFKEANVCLFVFDCLQFNDENLMKIPLNKRRKILQENMTPIKNHIMFSEMKPINDPHELKEMIHSVIQQGLEGLVIKDKKGIYEPGKRHWLKVKKDYLDKGAMADSADLVVLGAYYGTGNKGGMMSIFLMGCYNEKTEKWCTVTKVHGGHDDATLNRLQTELNMIKISKDPSKVPPWMNINKSLIPDFISADPKKSPVWEITGAEFSKAEAHTAGGVSIRFPRVTKIRSDKSWKQATSLQELLKLYKTSKETSDMIGLAIPKPDKDDDDDDGNDNDDNNGHGKTNKSLHNNSGICSDDDDDDDDEKLSGSKAQVSKPLKTEHKVKTKQPSKKRSSNKTMSPTKKPRLEVQPTSRKILETMNVESSIDKTVLPNVFSGVKLYIPSSLENAEVLRRYFIAYDGDLLKDEDTTEANIVIACTKSTDSSPKVRQVTPDWLWDSVKLQKRLPLDMYASDAVS